MKKVTLLLLLSVGSAFCIPHPEMQYSANQEIWRGHNSPYGPPPGKNKELQGPPPGRDKEIPAQPQQGRAVQLCALRQMPPPPGK